MLLVWILCNAAVTARYGLMQALSSLKNYRRGCPKDATLLNRRSRTCWAKPSNHNEKLLRADSDEVDCMAVMNALKSVMLLLRAVCCCFHLSDRDESSLRYICFTCKSQASVMKHSAKRKQPFAAVLVGNAERKSACVLLAEGRTVYKESIGAGIGEAHPTWSSRRAVCRSKANCSVSAGIASRTAAFSLRCLLQACSSSHRRLTLPCLRAASMLGICSRMYSSCTMSLVLAILI